MNVNQDKTLKWVIISMLVFFAGFGFIAAKGDLILTAMYPLYIAIFIGLLNTIKYRYSIIDQIEIYLLEKELKIGFIGTIVGVILSIILSTFKILAFGFIIPFYLFTISLAINTYVLWTYLNGKSNFILKKIK